MRLPARSAGPVMPASVRIRILVWKNSRVVKTGNATHGVGPRAVEMRSDDIDISETSNSPNRSWRQNISDGCTAVGMSLMPSGSTRPSSSGRVLGLSESARLSSTWDALIRLRSCGLQPCSLSLRTRDLNHLGQPLRLAGDERRELVPAEEQRLGAELREPVAHLVGLEAFDDCRAQLADDLLRRAGRRHDA